MAAAYGWSTDISDDDALRELLALNARRQGGRTEYATGGPLWAGLGLAELRQVDRTMNGRSAVGRVLGRGAKQLRSSRQVR